MISVCMATYNGAKYIREQIDSILAQLSDNDELVISDDHSTDNTCDIIRSYEDARIKLVFNHLSKGVTHNFENALLYSKGSILFFSDQDDVWFPSKIKELTKFLIDGNYDVVTCNCAMTDSKLQVLRPEYYTTQSPLDKSVIGNIIKDLWLGSCMAFKREILTQVLPIPNKLAAHDLWIALYSQMHFNCGYYPKVLQFYRRHENTVSFAGGKSTNKLSYKISYRIYLIFWLLLRSLLKK